MKFVLIFIISVTATVGAASVSSKFMEEWRMFKTEHGRTYENQDEEAFRMQVYQNNSRLIDEHNKLYAEGKVSFKLAMNKFGDLLLHEFEQMMTQQKYSSAELSYNYVDCTLKKFEKSAKLSAKWDWRDKGAVTRVKNQRSCGACWAFSATGALESHHFLKTGRPVNLSEQNLVDCTKESGNNGCKGGLPSKAFRYVIEQGGIDKEESYGYTAKDNGSCRQNSANFGTNITDCGILPAHDEEQLKIAVETVGPISVLIFASTCEFQFYKKGILYSNLCYSERNKINHAVLAIGFGTENGLDYWLVKNSWGPDWGEKGFFKIARNAGSHCGIASESTFPIN